MGRFQDIDPVHMGCSIVEPDDDGIIGTVAHIVIQGNPYGDGGGWRG